MPSLSSLPFVSRRRDTVPVTGSVVLVTGAANGIGAALTAELVSRGAKVVAVDVDREPLDALAARLGEAVLAVPGDVTDLGSMEDAVAAGVARFGGLDVVVANAGIASYGSVLGVDPATFRRVVDVNVTGVFHTVRAALPHVIERQGYVLVVSSLAAFTAAPGMAAYNASKAGAENFANALRLEVAHRGVAVGSAHMAWIDTPLVQDARRDLRSFDRMISKLPPPLNRTARVEECVGAFVTGIEERRRRVYVPGWVGAIASARTLANSPVLERETLRMAPEMVPLMDEEVARLGRSTSERNAVPTQPTA